VKKILRKLSNKTFDSSGATGCDDDDDDDDGRINFRVALSFKTTRTRNNKLKP